MILSSEVSCLLNKLVKREVLLFRYSSVFEILGNCITVIFIEQEYLLESTRCWGCGGVLQTACQTNLFVSNLCYNGKVQGVMKENLICLERVRDGL